MRHVWRQIKQCVKLIVYPWPALVFLRRSVGSEYGIGLFRKLKLMRLALFNGTLDGSASTFAEQLELVRAVLSIPKNLSGSVAEFGCYKGAATASLSAACAACGRMLKVFDSFAGLPEPQERVTNLTTGAELQYKAGDLTGTLDEVKRTVQSGGDLSVCEFVQGFYDATLPLLDPAQQFVLIFEDADLPESVRSVLTYCWPRLHDGCIFYCHEARDKEVIDLFYDAKFWRETLKSKSPGFTGSGCGLPLDLNYSMLGYSVKRNDQRV